MSVLGNNLLAQYYAQNQGQADVILVISTASQLTWGFRLFHYTLNDSSIIEWGDGTKETLTPGSYTYGTVFTHTYLNAGEYTVKLKAGKSGIKYFRINANTGNTFSDSFGYCAMVSRIVKMDGLAKAFGEANNSTFYDCKNAVFPSKLPESAVRFNNYPFGNCLKLNISELPEQTEYIGNGAFYNSGVSISEIPEGVTDVGSYALRSLNLVNITFKGKPTTINANAFLGCTNLTLIRVPWSEGEVANAPRGATNATIIYNYQS